AYQLTKVDHVYARAESVEKNRLLLETKSIAKGDERLVTIRAVSLGYLRDVSLGIIKELRTGLGADLTLHAVPSGLERVYGSSPYGAHLFLRVRWNAGHGGGHGMEGMAAHTSSTPCVRVTL